MSLTRPIRRQTGTHRPIGVLTGLARLPWISALLLLVLLMAADTNVGRAVFARVLSAVSGGQVMVDRLHGELPFRPRMGRLELADANGVWLRASDIALSLRPGALLRGELDIQALTIDRLELVRLPQTGPGDGDGFRLPLPLRLRQLVVAQLVPTALAASLPPLTVTGSARLVGADAAGELQLSVAGHDDRYRLALAPGTHGHRLTVLINERTDGALATLARAAGVRLPPVADRWTLRMELHGPLDALAVDAELGLGAHRASARGLIDLPAERLTALALAFQVAAVDAQPAGSLGLLRWAEIDAGAELSGPLRAPRGTINADARGVALAPAGATPTSPRAAALDARFAGALHLEGRFDLGDPPGFSGTLAAAPSQLPEPWSRLLEKELRLSVSARRNGPDWSIEQGRLATGRSEFKLAGRAGAERLDLTWALDLAVPGVLGETAMLAVDARGRAAGTPASPRIEAELGLRGAAPVAADGSRTRADASRVQGRLELEPTAPRGRLALNGRWLGAPMAVDLALLPLPAGGIRLDLNENRWAGISLAGRLDQPPGTRLPSGELRLGIPRLDAVAPLLAPILDGRAAPGGVAARSSQLGGRLDARLELAADAPMRLVVDGAALRLPLGVNLGSLALDGTIRPPFGQAWIDAQLGVTGLDAAGITGALQIRARGPLDDLRIYADAGLRAELSGAQQPVAVRLAAEAGLDLRARRLGLNDLRLDAQDRRLALLAPARIDFGAGLRLESLRLGLSALQGLGSEPGAGGVLSLAGQLAPRLSFDADLSGLDLPVLAAWVPALPKNLEGVLAGEASLTGRMAVPTGRVSLRIAGLGLADAVRLGLPRADGRLTLTLEEAAARVAVEAWMEQRARMTLDGRIGASAWSATAPLALNGRGSIDLALLDAWLGAEGRRAEGRVDLDLNIRGTRGAPRFDGRLGLADGVWSDRRLGLFLDGIRGDARLSGDWLRIERLQARAGNGTLALDGDIGLLAPGRPLDLRLRARNAQPIQLDLLSVRGDADLSLRGALADDLGLSGDLHLAEVAIRLPERLPADIPTLNVVELGERRQPRPARRSAAAQAWPARLRLDVRIDAPAAVQVRGRNMDAALSGAVRLRGNAAAPSAEGGFELQRGEYLLIGQPLRFTRGRIGLDGADLLDPTLDLEARTGGGGAVAILVVEGRARAPRVELRGEPPMPDDEVLSRLLFGVPPARLSGLQLTRLGRAAASIAGIGADGNGLLSRVRTGLGLERLRIDSDRRGGTVLEGGLDLGERVSIGGRQGLERGDPRAVLGLQLAPRIRFESDVGARGAGAGAAFELEY